jgi:hypothetical protein
MRRKQSAEQVVYHQLHVGFDWIGRCIAVSYGVSNEFEEQPTCKRPPLLPETTLRLGPEMGNQRLARKVQSQPTAGLVLTKVRHRPGRIDEHDVPHIELYNMIILGHRRVTAELKCRVVKIHTIEADIPVRSLDTVGIAGQINCLEPAYGLRSYPTGEDFGFDTLRVILPAE